jgi:Ankyrin repeat
MLDMTSRAKWDVWNLTGKTYQSRAADVENRYLDIARSFGWVEGTESTVQGSSDHSADDVQWDDESEDRSVGGGSGMGFSVSVMASPSPDEDELGTLHGLALLDDPQKLTAFLRENADADVNAIDEYVRIIIQSVPIDRLFTSHMQGFTPLHLASDRGNAATVQVLLDNGADQSIKVRFRFPHTCSS